MTCSIECHSRTQPHTANDNTRHTAAHCPQHPSHTHTHTIAQVFHTQPHHPAHALIPDTAAMQQRFQTACSRYLQHTRIAHTIVAARNTLRRRLPSISSGSRAAACGRCSRPATVAYNTTRTDYQQMDQCSAAAHVDTPIQIARG